MPADGPATAPDWRQVHSTGVFADDPSADSDNDLEVLEELSLTQALEVSPCPAAQLLWRCSSATWHHSQRLIQQHWQLPVMSLTSAVRPCAQRQREDAMRNGNFLDLTSQPSQPPVSTHAVCVHSVSLCSRAF
jgi:hypothetical protein